MTRQRNNQLFAATAFALISAINASSGEPEPSGYAAGYLFVAVTPGSVTGEGVNLLVDGPGVTGGAGFS